jgi:enoyl-[acyl-carrier protein] reductase III
MQSDPFSVTGKKILVTGGTRGIGQAISMQLASAGATVLANYVRDQKSAESLKETAAERGLSLEVCRADLTSSSGMDKLIDALDLLGPKLDGLVHCAATGVHRPLGELTLRHYDWTMNLNLRAFFDLTSRLLPRFEERSSIVALSSEGAVRAVQDYTLIGASKGALEAMVRHFAAELGTRGIRVNALSPGSVPSDAWKAIPDAEERLSEAKRRTPLGRLVTMEEIALSAHYLCSSASSGMTGHTLVVDGGCRIMS